MPTEPNQATVSDAPDAPSDDRVGILLVDDEPRNIAVLESILDDPGYRLVRAESGDQALLELVAGDFAVIVLDIHMPGISGFEVAQLIKKRQKTASIPIIFLTAHYSEDRHVLEGYQTGAVDYLHKPVNTVILRSKVAVFAELYRKTRENVNANRALMTEVLERRRIQEEMRALQDRLEVHVAERTEELTAANRALQQIQQELTEADRRKDQFLAMLGHELRNPLAPITNAVTILKQNAVEPSVLSWCRDVIERQAENLKRIVDDLLDVSRVSRGKIQIERKTIDLIEVLQQALEISRPPIEARGHRVTSSVPSTPVYVEGDFTRLAQVVANLLNNAAKYTDPGGDIWISIDQEPGSIKHAVLRVRDNGRGLTAQAIGNLFQLFYQADTNLDRSDGGLGIGLALVRSLVEMHGGTVDVRSEGRGFGAEFTVRLPLVESRPQAVSAGRKLPEPTQSSAFRILVVDDNIDAARSLAMMLQILGHSVVMAHDGEAAVEAARLDNPEVILLDIGLPRQNGYQVCKTLRQTGFSNALIIAATGYGQENDRQLAIEAGFNHHLVKPVDFAAVRQILQTFAETSSKHD